MSLFSYHIAVDSHRCSAPNKTADYQKIYSDWCNQFEKYKLAIKSWEKKKGKCSKVNNIGIVRGLASFNGK